MPYAARLAAGVPWDALAVTAHAEQCVGATIAAGHEEASAQLWPVLRRNVLE